MANYAGPERRKHFNIRELIENTPAGRRNVWILMARVAGPDRLPEIDKGLASWFATNPKVEEKYSVDGGWRPIHKPDVIEYEGWGPLSPEEILYNKALKDLNERRALERKFGRR